MSAPSSMSSTSTLLPLAISMGDPAGIGPEIICKALIQRPELQRRVVVYGHSAVFARAAAVIESQGFGRLAFSSSRANPDELPAAGASAAVALVDVAANRGAGVPAFGQVSPVAGRMAASAIREGARAVLNRQASALVTAPIHKEALSAAGEPFPGHTEMLQQLAADHQGVPVGDVPVRMMLSAPGLRTVLLSIHVSLLDALKRVTIENLLQTLRITQGHFSKLGEPGLRIAVAGVNPHAGEGGLFGREEIEVLSPAIAQARAEGMQVSGPHAPDTVFMRARQGDFDVVIAMYHDQGLIPVKYLGLEHGVNTTLGLPFLRTSPDHGTAFDLAGSGRASCASFLEALDQAAEYGLHWQGNG